MKSPSRTASLLMAAIVTLAIPALADSACACTTGDTGVGVNPVNAAVARITQSSPAFPSPNPGDEVIQSGTPAAVTYKIAYLDRNGEEDFEAPIMGSANPQQLLAVEILRPDGSFVTQTDAIAIPTANGCDIQQVARTTTTTATTQGAPQVEPADIGIGWILMSWDDAVPGNGIVSCDFVANYNSGSDTPVGVYTVRPSVINGIVSPPQVSGGSFRMQPIGYGSSQDVTTTVFNLQALSTTIGNTDGVIDFGAIKPGEIALSLGGIKLAPGDDVVVMNEEASQPTNLMITMQATDLFQPSTETPVEGDSSLTAGTRTYAPIPCDRLAIAMEREPTPGDAMIKSQGADCETRIFDTVPTLFPGQMVRFNAGILDPGRGTDNFAFAAGQYVGTLNVCLTGPGGQGDPITIGEAPTNPIPAFNIDLTQFVDEVGPAQNAA